MSIQIMAYNVPDCPSPRHGAYPYKSKFDSIYLKLTKYRNTWNVWIASLRSPSQTLKWKAHISPTLIFLASSATCQSGERLARPSCNKFILTVPQSSSSTSSRAETSLFFKKESRCAEVYFAESRCNERSGTVYMQSLFLYMTRRKWQKQIQIRKF
jgi:hypothetical protein